MYLGYSQGLVSYSLTPPSIGVDAPNNAASVENTTTPLVVVMARGKEHYMATITSKPLAWQGLPLGNGDIWLYVVFDDNFTPVFKYTTSPVRVITDKSEVQPQDVVVFNRLEQKLYEFKNGVMENIIGVVMGKIDVTNTFTPETIGDSSYGVVFNGDIGEVVRESNSGNALFYYNSDGEKTFATTATLMLIQDNGVNTIKPGMEIRGGRAKDNIPLGSPVSFISDNLVELTKPFKNSFYPTYGLSIANVYPGDTVAVVSNGSRFTNPSWNFTAPPGSKVWVSKNSSVTDKLDAELEVIQEVGKIVSSDTIIVNIKEPIFVNV